MKSKREIARSSRAMTNGAFTAMTGRSSFPRLCEAAERSRESAPRITKGLAALLMALALVFGFASCKTESEEETVYRTVTYSTEHATAPEKLTVADGTALTAEQLPALTAEGYTFGGWYDGQTKAEAGYKVTKDVTLTAKWTAVGTGGSDPQNPDTPTAPDDDGNTNEVTTYTVTFSTNGGTAITSQKIESGKTATEPTAPTKDGYIFGGWFTDSNFATAFTFSTAITADITLYAKWIEASKPTYTVTFSTDGGTAVAAQKIESGKTATEPTAPTKDGYIFGGWFTDSNFATAFTFSTAITADITLYAKWIEASKPTYTVTFTVDGTETKQTVAEGEKAVKPADPTKAGYTFVGWFNGESVFDFETAITENITLTAKWTLITYTITYEGLNGAANPNTATSYTVESETITLQNPTKSGYTFTGWFDAETGGNKIESIAKGSTEAKTLYAKWILGEKEKPSAVGDIVFSDGSATAYTSDLTLTDEQKSKAVAVIFYVGTECSNDSASRTLGVGLKNAGDDSTLTWAPSDTTGYTTNFTDIQCTRSETAPTDGTAYYSYTYSNKTYYVTGDFDGSDNWEKVCAADNTANANAATNYTAFNWVNNYGATNSLTGDMATGWYLPSCVELRILYDNKDAVNAALEAAGGTKIADTDYWSSSQDSSENIYAWSVWFGEAGRLTYNYKDNNKSVCGVRAF